MKPQQLERSEIEFARFKYRTPNGLIEAVGVVPKTKKSAPVILYFRGGTRDFGAIEHRTIANIMLPLARAGFAIFGSQYSEGPNSQGKDEYGGKDMNDIPPLVDALKSGPWKLNFRKLGVLGLSRGALMGMRSLQKGLKAKRAAFVSGLYDSRKIKTERSDIYKMWKKEYNFDPDDPAELVKRSPIAFATELPNIPYLLLHSKQDWRTAPRHAKQMASRLHNAKLVWFPGDDHGLIENSRERNQHLIEWFKQM